MSDSLCGICNGPRFLCGGCPLGVPRGIAPVVRVRTVIESPFGRNVDGSKCTPAQYARNIRYLNRCLADSMARNEAPYASHRFFPGLLDDTNPADRELGMQCVLAWAEAGKRVGVYLDHGETEGMTRGIAQHIANGLVIELRHIGAEPELTEEADPPLIDRLVGRLHSFFDRAAPLVRDGNGTALLKILLHQPGGDEDGALYLEAQIRETLDMGDEEGRVPGLRFGEEPE